MYNNKNPKDIEVDIAEAKVYLIPPLIFRFMQTIEQTMPKKPLDNPGGMEITIKIINKKRHKTDNAGKKHNNNVPKSKPKIIKITVNGILENLLANKGRISSFSNSKFFRFHFKNTLSAKIRDIAVKNIIPANTISCVFIKSPPWVYYSIKAAGGQGVTIIEK